MKINILYIYMYVYGQFTFEYMYFGQKFAHIDLELCE